MWRGYSSTITTLHRWNKEEMRKMTFKSMNADEFKEKLKEATTKATKVIRKINEARNKKRKEREYEYEATLNAQIYHQLLLSGVSDREILFENKPDLEEYVDKHIDLWFECDDGDDVLIEVKSILRLKNRKDKAGIIEDIIKLLGITKQFKTQKEREGEIYGIVIVSYFGDEYSNGITNSEETELIKQINQELKYEIKERKMSNKIDPDLVKVLLSFPGSNRNSKYHNLDL